MRNSERKMKDNRPTVGSLFSGGGGMDKGFEDAGFRVVWQCETNEACRQVLERRWPILTIFPMKNPRTLRK